MIIKLLDGTIHDRDELLEQMWNDDFYYNELDSSKVLSSSSVKNLFASPKRFFNPKKSNYGQSALILGHIVHTIVLESDKVDDKYEIIDVKSRKTKTFEEAQGSTLRQVILRDEYDTAEKVANAVRNNPVASELLVNGMAEVPALDTISGVPFRGKADYLTDDLIVDLKTTSDIDRFCYRGKYTWHYDIQAYIYMQLFKVKNFIFVAVDKETLDVGVFPLSQQSYESGKSKLDMAIKNYNEYSEHPERLDEFTIRGTF
jgi:hypothetical protein